MMTAKDRYMPRVLSDRPMQPFDTAEEAWFWFVQAQQARAEGAKIKAGLSGVERPCEPLDIFRAMERLYRARRLTMDHILVLRNFGRRGSPPDVRSPKEMRAYDLWHEALGKLEDVLGEKGIVTIRPWYHLPAEAEPCRI